MDIIRWGCLVLSSGWFTTVYCIAVVGFGYLQYRKFLKNRKRIGAALDNAHKKLNGLEKLRELGSRKSANRVFYDNLDEGLRRDPVLQAAWCGFSRQVHRPEEYGLVSENLGCGRISLKDPREFFHEESLWLNQFNERWFASLPNLLTGLGILGTFLGLVAGLTLADISIDGQNLSANKVADAFKPLIGGAGQAFWTSIVGLVASFVYGWKFKQGSFESLLKIERLNEAIDEKFRVLSPEEIGLLNHKAQRDQLDTVRSISDGWHAGMKELLEAVTGSIKDLQQLLEGFSKEQLEKIQSLMESEAESFAELRDLLQGLSGEQLAKLQELMGKNAAALASIEKAVSVASDAQLEALREMKASSASSFAGLSESFKGFSGEQLSQLQQVMEGLLGNLSKVLSEEMGKMTGVVQETAVAIGNSAAALDGTLDKMTSAATTTSDKVNASLQMLDERVGNMANKLESTSASLNSACENAAAAVGLVGEKMIACAGSTSEIIKGAGDKLSNSAKAGGESLEASAVAASQKLSAAGDAFAKSVDGVGTHFSASLVEGAERLSVSLKQQAEVLHQVSSFHKSLEELGSGISGLAESLKVSGRVIESSVSAARNLEKSVNSIMKDVQANILEANEINTKALKEGLASVTSQIAAVTAAQAKLVSGVDAMQKRIAETAQKTQSSIAVAADKTQQSIAKGSSDFLEFMVKVSEQLSRSSALVSESFNKNVTDLDRGISSAVTNLASGLTSWQKARERDQKAGEAAFKDQMAAIDSTIGDWKRSQTEELKKMQTAQAGVNASLKQLQGSLKSLSEQIGKLAAVHGGH